MRIEVRPINMATEKPAIQITKDLGNVFIDYKDIKKLIKKIKASRKEIKRYLK